MGRRFDQGNKEIAKEKEERNRSDELADAVFDALLRSKDSCLIYQVTRNNTFHKIIQSINIEVAILAHRKSGPMLFQGILSSRWWYQ